MEEYLLSEEGLAVVDADVPLGAPALTSFYEKIAAKDPLIAATMKKVELGEPMPPIPAMGAFWAAMQPALENMTQGRQKAQEALDNAKTRIVK